MNTKRGTTYPEVLATHFPDQTLNLLETRLCLTMGLTEPKQHFMYKDKDSPSCGFIEVAIPKNEFYKDKRFIQNQVKEFYSYRGFDTKGTDEELISAKKNDESYSISVFETETTYIVSISENLLE